MVDTARSMSSLRAARPAARPDGSGRASGRRALGWPLLAALLLSCSGTQQAADPRREQSQAAPVAPESPGATPRDNPAQRDPGPITKGSMREHPAAEAYVFGSEQQGKPAKKITLDSAEARGLTVIDLGNDWVPYIFSEKTAGVEDHTVNDYRARYIGLANNRVDDDGEKLRAHERNFLEGSTASRRRSA